MKFSEFIQDFRGGHLDNMLTTQFQSVNEAVNKLDEKGIITLKITIAPGRDKQMNIQTKITAKKPSNDTLEAIMFMTPDNNLTSSDPKQSELFVKKPKDKEVYIQAIK
jgi:hypothetical protein